MNIKKQLNSKVGPDYTFMGQNSAAQAGISGGGPAHSSPGQGWAGTAPPGWVGMLSPRLGRLPPPGWAGFLPSAGQASFIPDGPPVRPPRLGLRASDPAGPLIPPAPRWANLSTAPGWAGSGGSGLAGILLQAALY
jgi:hypothetical protein